MTDYGRAIEFGFFPAPAADDYKEILAQVRLAEESGLDLVGIQDHPYQRRFLDTFSLISDLAARTERLRFFPDVACLPLRSPSVLAKMAASIDRLSSGRFELGVGAGAFWDAIEGMGGPRREPADAVASLAEAIEVLRLMWSGERGLRFEGRHYRLKGIHSGPLPAHDIGIWIGGGGPRMLRLIGRAADGWIPQGRTDPRRFPELHERIDDAAAAAGREPRAVRRIYNIAGTITEGDREGFLTGGVSYWVDELTRLAVEIGMDGFVLWPATDPSAQLRRYAEEVVPAVRREVAVYRGEGS